MTDVRVLVQRAEDGRSYYSTIHRDDGIVLLLPGFDRKYRVPHDLAHLVTERQLCIPDGVFGSIASGALFGNMSVVSGRLRHDARRRSAQILRANSRGIGVAEMLSGVIHHAVEQRDHRQVVMSARAAWASQREDPFPYPTATIRAAANALDDLGQQWTALPPNEPLTINWRTPH